MSILLVRYALPALFAFVIALLVSFLLKPIIHFLTHKCHFNKNIAAVIIVLLFYGIIGFAVVLLGLELFNALMSIIKQLPDFYKNTVSPALLAFAESIQELIENFDEGLDFSVTETLSGVLSTLGTSISAFSVKVLSTAGNTAVSVPRFLLNVIITIISTVFLSMDWTAIRDFIMAQFPEKTTNMFNNIVKHLGLVIRKYIVSYALIMLITFLEIFIGLEIIGIENALLIAALIAVFDILPIVGSGLILFPWAVISLFTNEIGNGIGLLILWAVVIIVRYIIEPKIVGDSVGLHPLLTLFAMIAGSFLYGGIGILVLPVSLALIQSLNDSGIIHLYKTVKTENEDGTNPVNKKVYELFGKMKNKFQKKK